MNKFKQQSKVKALLTVTLLTLMFASCAKKMTFVSSPVVPAALGSVKLKTDKNKNTTVQVSVTHLAPSSKLSPPKDTYVVWMETETDGIKNMGQLISSGGVLSKKLKGSLKAVTAFTPTGFYITAEDNGNVKYPSSTVILTTH